jgi:hypothetical protein
MEIQKEYNLRYLLAKVRTTWGKASDRLRQRANKRNKTVSDVFRHRSRIGKLFCRTKSDVGSERVKESIRASLSHNGRISDFYPIYWLRCKHPRIYHHFDNNQLETLNSYNPSCDLGIYSVNLIHTRIFLRYLSLSFNQDILQLTSSFSCQMCTWEIAS